MNGVNELQGGKPPSLVIFVQCVLIVADISHSAFLSGPGPHSTVSPARDRPADSVSHPKRHSRMIVHPVRHMVAVVKIKM